MSRADDWQGRGDGDKTSDLVYVWNEYLMLKPGTNSLCFIPDANHYLQADRPDAFVSALLHALEPGDDHQPGALDPEPAAPLLVDTSRPRLPAAHDLLRPPARPT